jgi:UDP-N-acetylglucosamine--N-acetylmuramyl-(pentapeptide) pyrophosphoryl-undecaprenol N-acetylglucosamine transferase
MKIIISGGGTGGHVYPAIAIADELKKRGVEDILFVGAEGKLEMEKVPLSGYPIEGLKISGFHRQRKWRNYSFLFKLITSLAKARKIIDKFKPDVVIGVGGYASGPVLNAAQRRNIPTLIQEQNSYPGVTNKLLAKKAHRICVAYNRMEKFFDANKIMITGNPVRKDLMHIDNLRIEALSYFGLDQNKKTILIFGGSLGARSINNAVEAQLDLIKGLEDVQFLWQVGKIYIDQYSDSNIARLDHVHVLPFIDRMDLAYSCADVVVCRAGALTISELCITGRPCVLVPSPNVAEDHQTKNAEALTKEGAALLVSDKNADQDMIIKAVELINDKRTQESLSQNLKRLAMPQSSEVIVDEILKLGSK